MRRILLISVPILLFVVVIWELYDSSRPKVGPIGENIKHTKELWIFIGTSIIISLIAIYYLVLDIQGRKSEDQ